MTNKDPDFDWLIKGARVVLSEWAFRDHVAVYRDRERVGTVVGFGRHESVRVKWDGRKTAESWHRDYLCGKYKGGKPEYEHE